jgi:hypothetical protein
MPGALFPRSDKDLLAWSLNLSTKITATPTAYNLTAAIATSYAAVHASYASALALCDPTDRNKTHVVNKNNARATLKREALLVVNQVNAGANVTPGQKTDLGIPIRATPQPQPVPSVWPAIIPQSVNGWTVLARIGENTSSNRRGRPAGTSGTAVFSYVGPTAPSNISDWKFEGNTGKSEFTISFDSSLPAGTRVFLTAFYFNGRKQSGPLCPPVGLNLQGGSVSRAA